MTPSYVIRINYSNNPLTRPCCHEERASHSTFFFIMHQPPPLLFSMIPGVFVLEKCLFPDGCLMNITPLFPLFHRWTVFLLFSVGKASRLNRVMMFQLCCILFHKGLRYSFTSNSCENGIDFIFDILIPSYTVNEYGVRCDKIWLLFYKFESV